MYIYNGGRGWQGEWLNGYRHGRGSVLWPDGTSYTGQWMQGFPHGPGTWCAPPPSLAPPRLTAREREIQRRAD